MAWLGNETHHFSVFQLSATTFNATKTGFKSRSEPNIYDTFTDLRLYDFCSVIFVIGLQFTNWPPGGCIDLLSNQRDSSVSMGCNLSSLSLSLSLSHTHSLSLSHPLSEAHMHTSALPFSQHLLPSASKLASQKNRGKYRSSHFALKEKIDGVPRFQKSWTKWIWIDRAWQQSQRRSLSKPPKQLPYVWALVWA